MKRFVSSVVTSSIVTASLLLGAGSAFGQCNLPRLQVSNDNPRYFSEVGTNKVVYLTGSHTWTNFQGWSETNPNPSPNSASMIARLRQEGHNFMRGWTWEQSRWAPWTTGNLYFGPHPYQRSSQGGALDGGNKFDLDRWNESYFDHLRSVIQDACENDIYVGVMLFQGWSFQRHHSNVPGDPWPGHPFHRQNNINGLDADPNNTGEGLLSHTTQLNDVLTQQQRYVSKMVAELGSLPNIIWEISNESHTGPAPFGNSRSWQEHWIRFVQSEDRIMKHPIWMTGSREIPNSWLNQSAADVVSYGGSAYGNDPLEADGQKVSLLDTDHIYGLGGSYVWVWKAFTNGHNPIFMDPVFMPSHITIPPSLDAPRIRDAMGATRTYAEQVDMAEMTPRDDWCDDLDSDPNDYCLIDPGNAYFIFQPNHSTNGSTNSISVRLTPGTYTVKRINTWNNTVQASFPITQTQDGWRTLAGGSGRPFYFIKKENVGPQTETIPASDDAWVIQNRPNDNIGTVMRLRVRWSGTGVGKRAFIKFPLPSLGTVQSATLKLKTLAQPIEEVGIYRMNGLNWSEHTITWNNHLPPGSNPFTHLTTVENLSPNTEYDIDVTNAFNGLADSALTIGMATGSLDMGMDFSSKEGEFAPVLEIVHMP